MNNTEAEQATNELQTRLRNWLRNVLEWVKYIETDEERLRTLEELCQKGADLHHLQNERGLAVIPHVFWSPKLIQFFLDRGMNINSRLENGDTVLHLNIRNFYKPICEDSRSSPYDDELKVIKYLLDQSADPNITNLRGETALFDLARRELWKTTDYEIAHELVNLFRERGADFGVRNIDGETLLHVHAPNSCGNLIVEFIEGDINVASSARLYSLTPLMAVHNRKGRSWRIKLRNKFRCCCQQLVEKGADVNACDLQGYTALHYAVLNGSYECAEYFVKKGADPNAKSSTEKDAYHVIDINCDPAQDQQLFTYGATPTKLVQIYEMSGAMEIIMLDYFQGGKNNCVKVWDKAMDVCREFNLQPTQEFLANYKFLKAQTINYSPEAFEEMFLSAMNTVARLSETEMYKFWTLLSFVPDYINSDDILFLFKCINFLSEEFKRVEEFASFELADFKTLSNLVGNVNSWLWEEERKNESFTPTVTPEQISHMHSISHLIVACFNKLITHVTKSKVVSYTCTKLYITMCNILTVLHYNFDDVMTKSAFSENKLLLRTLIHLDLRDGDSNSLLHHALKPDGMLIFGEFYQFEFDPKLSSALMELVKTRDRMGLVKTRNLMGFEPFQCISWNYYDRPSEALTEMADRGAHVDARHITWGVCTVRDMNEENHPELAFKYDSLQCACARVIAQSLVPFVNRVPKIMVDFIRMHLNSMERNPDY